MPQNQYKPWATGTGANTLDPATYAARGEVQQGVQNGIADPTLANTAWRQSSVVSAMVAQFIADNQTGDVLDNGSVSTLETQFGAALTTVFAELAAANGGVVYGVDQSTTPGIVSVTSTTPSISAFKDGLIVAIDIANSNPSTTLAVSLPVNGVSNTYQAVRPGNLGLRSGDVSANGQALFVAFGGKLQLINPQAVQGFFTRTLSPGGPTRTVAPADSNGMFYVFTNSSGVAVSTTLNLPNASTMGGAIVSGFNNAAGGVTMTINTTPQSGANYILTPPGSTTQIVLKNYSSFVTLYSDGGNWLVIGSSVDVGSSWGSTISTGTNGVKRADGIIENWGVLTLSANSSQTFALLYPYAVQGYPQATAQVNSTTTGYTVHAVMASNSQLTISNPNAATISIGWRVTGT